MKLSVRESPRDTSAALWLLYERRALMALGTPPNVLTFEKIPFSKELPKTAILPRLCAFSRAN